MNQEATPLSGLRVIDLTRVLAGPFATMILGDMGAEVIKIERPGTGDDTRAWGPPFVDGTSTYYLSVNRNKKSVTLDLGSEPGRRILDELLADADVLVSNFRPGVMEDLGFGYETVHERHPRLVYAELNGYGSEGPSAERPAYDFIVQAETGLMDITGMPDGPPTKAGVAIADEIAGLYLVQGILLALLERQGGGAGQRVEVALHDAMLSMLSYQAQQALSTGEVPRRMGNAHPSIVPYQTFRADDGEVAVGVGNRRIWKRFCRAIGRPELADAPEFASNADRVENRDLLEEELAPVFAARDVGYWRRVLTEARVPCTPVRDVGEALRSEIAAARRMVVRCPGSDLDVLGIPVKLDRSAGSIRRPPPSLGQHTREVLADLGHGAEEIESWERAGIV